MSVQVRVWDLGVRLFHWSLVAAFAIAYLSGDNDTATLHAWLGYAIIALLAFRLAWGLVGNKHARFTDFVYAPRHILAHLKTLIGRRPRRYLGHNPVGGLMVVTMLVMLAVVSWTGLQARNGNNAPAISAITFAPIPDAHADDNGGEGFWELAHEASVDVMLALIVLHLAGVTLVSVMHHENLPHAMVSGRKRRPEA